ncbi:hypothetical protein [Sulfurimonas sp.]
MTNYQTIQKLASDVGIDESYIRAMIRNDDLTAYKKDGYKRIFINVDEFNETIKPVNSVDEKINLDDYLV